MTMDEDNMVATITSSIRNVRRRTYFRLDPIATLPALYFMLTQHEAQLYLAEQLPDVVMGGLEIHNSLGSYFYWRHKGHHQLIPEESWQQIALWVEEKIPNNRKGEYMSEISEDRDWETCHANYIIRASAMKELWNTRILTSQLEQVKKELKVRTAIDAAISAQTNKKKVYSNDSTTHPYY